MSWISKLSFGLFIVVSLTLTACAESPKSSRSEKATAFWTPKLTSELEAKKLSLGAPVFFRILKTKEGEAGTGELQSFVQIADGTFTFFKAWVICTYSGELGPKKKQGDQQSPEGFYFVTPGRLNPNSSYHLSFNLGYPNAYDRAHGRTGDFLMVHGDCVSIGCYAMTDEGIEEIYTLLQQALDGGQPFVRVHIFPFEMNDETLRQYKDSSNYAFWKNLKEGWDYFEQKHVPPNVEVSNKRYVIENMLERELCFQKIKAAYDNDVTWFRLDDRKCLRYLPEFERQYRTKVTPP